MAIGGVGSSGINDWLAVAAFGGLARTQPSQSNAMRSASSQEVRVTNRDITSSSAPIIFFSNQKISSASLPNATDGVRSKQRVQENTSVESLPSHGYDALAQLHTLYANPQTLADIQPVRISLSSYDLAKMQEERDNQPSQKQAYNLASSFSENFETQQDAKEDSSENDEPLQTNNTAFAANLYQQNALQVETYAPVLQSFFG